MILVTGATGSIGRYLVGRLAEQGRPLRALVRDSAKGKTLGGVPFVVGDFDDLSSIAEALSGVDTLFLNGAVGLRMARQQIDVINCAVARGVTRIVRISAAGANATSDRAINRWHASVDDHLARTDIAWSLLKPTIFMQALLGSAPAVASTSTLSGGFGSGQLAFIDCKDIATCAAALLVRHSPSRDLHWVTGPQAVSFGEIADKLSARLGRPIRYQSRKPDELVAAMIARGMAPEVADSFGRMMAAFGDGGVSPVTDAVEKLIGHPPRTIDHFIDDHIHQFT